MTDGERLQKFDADFAKLQHNREKVPLEELRTRYAKAYNALVAEVEAGADWFAATYINTLIGGFPIDAQDAAGNERLRDRVKAIIAEERKPGGRFERYKAALLERLDRREFEQLVWEIFDRVEREAYDPYFQQHCRWTGEPGKRWIYSDVLKMFWCDPDRRPDHWKEKGYFDDGCWISADWKKQDARYTPKIKEDTDGQKSID